ncbi:MAG: hypothetical protein ACTSWC_01930 [Promethearchaeota archaeon]
MSLDKFGVKVKSKTQPEDKKSKKSTKKSSKISIKKKTTAGIRRKFYLKCTTKCGYQRTLRKRELSEEDYRCEKCGKTMKLVKKI